MEETPSEGDSWLLSASLWSVNGGPSGHVELQFPPSEENLPRFVHTHHLSRETREDVRRRLLDTVLRVSFPWGSFSSIDDSELLSKLEEEKLVTAQWESPSEEYNRVDACMPENYAGFSEEETSAFEERSMHMDWCAGGRDKECDLRMVWGSRRARMSGKERIRGRSGGMPLMPGGGEWGAGSGTAVQAAVTEAGSGLWLEELEACMRTGRSSSRIAPPGMSKGAFGAWSDQHEASHDGGGAMLTPSGVEPDEWDLATETRERIEDLQEQAGDKPSDGGNVVKVHLDSLFDGVWVDEGLEDREEEEKELMEEDEVLNADERTSNVKDTPEQLKLEDKVTHSDKPVEVIESLLPEYGLSKFTQAVDEDHFMNSESSELMAVLNKASAIASNSYNPWDRNRFALPFEGSLKDPAGQRDGRKQTGEPSTWAIRAAVKDLERTWDSLKPNLAKTWPFELDIFQKEAIIHMEMGHSVFVAAHTSAGKTVAAEYAFALAEKHCSRAVYTSPIKTISNQKFRDFSQSDFEVGLLTGDVSIKPESSCLIMTTEILRSMLYKGADIVRDIEWVIFDEVHYVNDAERGVVWEEVIIMLPQHINLVLLSATVPNVLEFADWVGRTKRKPVYVTGTTRRPVPLQHCLYYSGQLFTISSQTTGYDGRGYRQAKEMHIKKHALPQTKAEAKAALPTGRGGGRGLHGSQARGRSSMTSGRGGGGRGHQSGRITREIREGARAHSGGAGTVQLRSEKTQWNAMIEFLRKKDLLPMVVFCFSKKRCDALADVLKSLDLTNSSEKSEIHIFCDRAVSRLRGSDKELPQVLRIREMLKRGLGVHHAGLLPIVKEMVEMLFCRGVIKVLFSTETFAMGVNAPARTVVFQSLRKHDGRSFRSLLPGEYTQMAGRAGRRGLDDVGTVIIVAWDLPEEVELRRLLTGAATKLESQFRLTYSMILNLLRVEDLTVEDMMKRSFAEFHAQRSHPEVKKAIQRAQKVLKHLRRKPWPASPLDSTREDVEEYVDVVLAAEGLEQKVQAAIMSTRGATAALASGRIVLVRQRDTGATEIGIIIDALSSASSGDLGAGRKGPSSSSLLSSSKPETLPVNGGDAELLNRTRVVLMLHRPSPLDDIKVTVLQEGGESFEKSSGAQKSERSDLEAQPPPELGMKALKRKDDDDDEFSVSVGPGRKGAGGKGRKGKHSKPPLPAAAPIPLPAHGSVGAIPYVLRHVRLADMVGVAKSKVQVDDESIITGDKVATAAAVNELLKLQENDAESSRLSLMDPISDLKLNDFDTAKAAREHQQLLRKLASLKVNRDPLLPEMLAIVRSEKLLAARLSKLDRQVSDAGLAQLPEFNHRVLVLQKLGYLDAEKTVTMKGRVACEINSGDELVATEMIFSGVLTDLTPEEAVAVLSALVFQEKTDGEPAVPESLERARDLAMTVALAAGEVQREAGLDILPEEFVASTLRFGLVEVVYEWAKGTPFAEICQLTDVMEGSIVRTMVRLDETCREVRDAARVMGDMTLYKQMEEASEAIKRDIVFAASLYVA